MKLKIMYGGNVSSYRPICLEDNSIEFAPYRHQICLSNDFQYGWQQLNDGEGGWFMECCWIKGLQKLTREQLKSILKNVVVDIGEQISGDTVDDMVQNTTQQLDRFLVYIAARSPILLKNLQWKWNNLPLFKQRIQTMLDAGSGAPEY